jgi:hypothetical protein
VLLLPDAGLWVGLNEILPTHPAKRVGFSFHPLSAQSDRDGRTGFQNLDSNGILLKEKEENYDY